MTRTTVSVEGSQSRPTIRPARHFLGGIDKKGYRVGRYAPTITWTNMALNSMAAGTMEAHRQGTTAPVSQSQSQSQSESFLPCKLISLLGNPSSTVTSSLASNPSSSIESVATQLYGKHHGYAHHSLHTDQAKEHEKEGGGAIEKVMEKLHLGKSQETHEGEGEDKDETNPASDQWKAIRLLRGQELEEVRKCGQWGGAQPSELFLNVSRLLVASGIEGFVDVRSDAGDVGGEPVEWVVLAGTYGESWGRAAHHHLRHPGHHRGMRFSSALSNADPQ